MTSRQTVTLLPGPDPDPDLVPARVLGVLATSGRFVGAFTGSRLGGLPARDSAVPGTLTNTRGLTELIILSVGLRLAVLDTDLYALMAAIAVVTTAMAGPLLSPVRPQQQPAEEHVPVPV